MGELLTEGFIAAERPAALTTWLADQRRLWLDEVNALELPWFAEIKREEGAFATFLGVGVRAPTAKKRGGWRAVAVGDSCLIQVRDGRCVHAFPLQKAGQFSNQPNLIASRRADPNPDLGRGALETGDRLLLMTDGAGVLVFAHAGKRRRSVGASGAGVGGGRAGNGLR